MSGFPFKPWKRFTTWKESAIADPMKFIDSLSPFFPFWLFRKMLSVETWHFQNIHRGEALKMSYHPKGVSDSRPQGVLRQCFVCSLILRVWYTVFCSISRFLFKNRKADRKGEKLRKITVFIYGITVLRIWFTVTVTVTVTHADRNSGSALHSHD